MVGGVRASVNLGGAPRSVSALSRLRPARARSCPQRGDADNRRHGRIFRIVGAGAGDARRLVRRHRSDATCSRASRRGSTGRSPTSSASRRCRSACRVARFSRKAASLRTGPSTPIRRRTSSRIRTGCRSRRTRSTSSCCRMRSSSRAIRISCCARSIARSAPKARSSSRASIRSACSAPSAISDAAQTPPWNGSFIALYRLKDWLALLGFEVVGRRSRLLRAAVREREVARALRLFRGGRRPLVADRRAASTTCARRRRFSACASSRRRGSTARTASRPRPGRRARASSAGQE